MTTTSERPFKEKPDFAHLRAVLLRECRDGPVPLLELLADAEIMAAVTGIPYPAEMNRPPMFRTFMAPYHRRGIDCGRALDPDAIRADVEAEVPVLLHAGGYIAAIDHLVAPDVSLESFEDLLQCVRSVVPGK